MMMMTIMMTLLITVTAITAAIAHVHYCRCLAFGTTNMIIFVPLDQRGMMGRVEGNMNI